MHTQAEQACGEPSGSSSRRDRNPLRDYMAQRGSRFINAIRGLGGCAPRGRGYDQPAMDPSRASHSRRSSSARQEPVPPQSRQPPSASEHHVSRSGAAAEDGTQPPPASMTPPAAASTHQEDFADWTQQTPGWSGTADFDWGAVMHGSATFTDILGQGGQYSQDLNAPGSSQWFQDLNAPASSQWYQQGEPSAHWTPSTTT